MSLNIKNNEAHRLAQQLAKLTGESMTTAVTEAVRERLQRIRSEVRTGMAEQLMEIARDSGKQIRENDGRNLTNLWTMATFCTMKMDCRNDRRHLGDNCPSKKLTGCWKNFPSSGVGLDSTNVRGNLCRDRGSDGLQSGSGVKQKIRRTNCAGKNPIGAR
jgi:antitoxin VapB